MEKSVLVQKTKQNKIKSIWNWDFRLMLFENNCYKFFQTFLILCAKLYLFLFFFSSKF